MYLINIDENIFDNIKRILQHENHNISQGWINLLISTN